MRVKTLVFALGLLSLFACTSKDTAPPEPKKEATPAPAPAPAEQAEAAQDPMAEATEVFSTYCSTCHGAEGKGDGAGAAALQPKPRDLTSAEWQGSVDDEHITKIITGGGLAVGLSASMPPWPFATQKPEVVEALVQIVRGLGKE